MWFEYRPYVSVAERKSQAAKLTAKLKKQGRTITPVTIEGRTIASTFWGKAWCDHLEKYSDYENRLPRGRTYVRNGSVIDLQIGKGKIIAMVSGSEVYDVEVRIDKLDAKQWKDLKAKCAGQLGSVLELLKGRFDKSVMAILTDRDKGMFPAPREIHMECSCPDWAGMCKHIAAVMYGVGARLDHQPELLFVLRQVDHLELLDPVTAAGALAAPAGDGKKTIKEDDLADVFGIDLDATPVPLPKSKAKKTVKTKVEAKPKAAPKKTTKAVAKTTKKAPAPPKTKGRKKT